ncbi:MAG: hypothetical protein WEB06_20880 [Actinomycetota bacterium]
MNTVLHTMQRYLPLSEQFVHTLLTRTAHRAVVVSRDPIENRETFPIKPLYSLARVAKRHDPPTISERRILTAAITAIGTAHRVKLVHHHHAYRLSDVLGAVRRLKLPLVVSVHGQDVTAFARQWPGAVPSGIRCSKPTRSWCRRGSSSGLWWSSGSKPPAST